MPILCVQEGVPPASSSPIPTEVPLQEEGAKRGMLRGLHMERLLLTGWHVEVPAYKSEQPFGGVGFRLGLLWGCLYATYSCRKVAGRCAAGTSLPRVPVRGMRAHGSRCAEPFAEQQSSNVVTLLLSPRCRRYPTVEKRATFFNGSSYVPVPEDGPFLQALLFELRLTDDDTSFVERRDGCSRISKTSVYALQAERGELWPVVAFQKRRLIYVALPLVEQSVTPRPPLFGISGVSQAFDLLSRLLVFMSAGQKGEGERNAKLGQLPSLLMQACPLGTPLDSSLSSPENNAATPGGQPPKPPAWRSSTYKGKPQVNVCITEKVKSVQYDNGDLADVWQVYGTVTCKCDIEGAAPSVTISLNLPANGSPLQDILVHPCVSSLDSAILTSSSVGIADDSAFSGPYKFPLIPPPDQFNLCFYTSQVPVPPFLGFYQLREEEAQWKFSIHLKLHESVKNAFEYCEARVPFFNR
ncbi:AP-5 complex subunit mu-1 [Varanus komodoensis]|nr:AP-5 complex subunit mu-1 [Varanus komodoensis]